MRIAFNIALIASILYLPWWMGAILLVAACLAVDHFYEAILYGIAVDALYATRFGFHGFAYVATLYALVIFVSASIVRKRLAW